MRFNESHSQIVNSEKAFFYTLGTIAKVTKEISKPLWKDSEQFGTIHARMLGQRKGPNAPINRYLCYLDISGAILDMRDFYGADLSYSNLSSCFLNYTILNEAELIGANFDSARFLGTPLIRTKFIYCTLYNSRFMETDFRFTTFADSNLTEIGFFECTFKNVILDSLTLQASRWDDTKLELSNINNCDFSESKFSNVKFLKTPLKQCITDGIRLYKTTIKEEKLVSL